MKVERHQIKFEKGLVDGQLFVQTENRFKDDPSELVASIKKLGCENRDLELYFASSQRDRDKETITWFIDADSTATFEFKELSSLSDQQREDIEQRSSAILREIDTLLKATESKRNDDKELIETLQKIVSKQAANNLFSGFDPINNTFFPVLVGWNGDVSNSSARDLGLRGAGIEKPQNIDENDDINPEKVSNSSGPNVSISPLQWLLWLIAFLLILCIAYLVLPACGLKGLLQTCPPAEDPINALQNKRNKLIKDLELEGNICAYQGNGIFDDQAAGTSPDLGEPTIETVLTNETELNNRLEREGGNTSKLMVSLLWNTREDLDLKVSCPNGNYVNHGKRDGQKNQCGNLDVDANVASKKEAISSEPVENINLIEMAGSYEIQVKSVTNGNSLLSGTPFEVVLLQRGKIRKFNGLIKPGEAKVFRFENLVE
jgi:hypothetical protein